jgi:selenocysteine lyase/cysteine desulfurase
MGSDGAIDATFVGDDLEVPLVGGARTRYVNLDYAASTPALFEVWAAVEAFLPWYSSVHRGAGFKSQISTAAYEGARESVRSFVGGREDDVVLFTRNTTDAINLFARCVPSDTLVITTSVEHHANLLPWRKHGAIELSVPNSPRDLLEGLRQVLFRRPLDRPALLAVTGASNVTGEVFPLAELTRLAHDYGARIFVDAAQLAPHRAIDMSGLDLDWVVFSGHKLYAPFGAGALVGRSTWLAAAEPYLAGGGAVVDVRRNATTWAGVPDRHEGGSPNVVGAIALAAACTALRAMGMDNIARHETKFSELLQGTLRRVPGLVSYTTWRNPCDRVATVAFNVRGRNHAELAAILSAEYGIGVRNGSFCAYPLLTHLARDGTNSWTPGCGENAPGAVRASLGLGTHADDLAKLGDALVEIAEHGPRWRYRFAPDGAVRPEPDDRSWPTFDLLATRPS